MPLMRAIRLGKAKGLNLRVRRTERVGNVKGARISEETGMLLDIPPGWLFLAVAGVATLSFFLGTAVDALLRDDAFGALGNTLVLTCGFFGALLCANSYGIDFDSLKEGAAAGTAGAMGFILFCSAARAVLARI